MSVKHVVGLGNKVLLRAVASIAGLAVTRRPTPASLVSLDHLGVETLWLSAVALYYEPNAAIESLSKGT